ncbi:uncharacterized protein LOC105696809 [Orussus abietinus]|uniref:uncharacterized protein LOC105696809 n=1 Tax=Orussus abietinus TaxID=222816 RepID=UPI000626146A|nr:uncharacterized protein LOC105696809 [Orussus abietinus]XP_012274967.1 uncharacterized protein LOC105696809 [Orussus abietinus]XP_012274968.1 uncharacterized protein LOC105696809 [Orussus abietinus]
MAQGKLKVKSKLPPSSKTKSNKKAKGPPVHRRDNAPVKAKKTKLQEAHKLKQMISKNVNKSVETELRQRALNGKQSLTKKDAKPTTEKRHTK